MNVTNIVSSGLIAYEKAMGVAANNIANADTEGYRKVEGVFSSVEGGGVKFTTDDMLKYIENAEKESAQKNNVNVTEELVDINKYAQQYQALAKVLEAQGKMHESLLDIFV